MARASRRFAVGIGAAGLMAACLGAASIGQAHLRSATDPTVIGTTARLSLDTQARLGIREPGADEEARVVLGPAGRDVRLSGPLSEGTADRLERLLSANPDVTRIHLTSEGGLADEGRALGQVIAAHGLTTYVPDYCVSACTLAFVRGRERHILAVARLGFHGPYEEGPFGAAVPAESAPERAAYIAAGVSAAFVETALAVSPDEIWTPEPQRLIEAGVATAVVDTFRYPDSGLDDGDDLDHARATVLRNFAELRSIAARGPEAIDAIAAWYRDAYCEGRSEGEAVIGLKRLAARALAQGIGETDVVAREASVQAKAD